MKSTVLIALTVLLAATNLNAQQASGSLDQRSAQCDQTASGSDPETCSDQINVSINVASTDAGQRGAFFVAILPLAPDGSPVSSNGGYATQSGWTVSPIPAPYAVGTLPPNWTRTIPVDGGICNQAKEHGLTGAVKFGVFAGYGLVPAITRTPDQDAKRAQALAEAKATGNPDVIAYVEQTLAQPATLQVDGERAAASMLQEKTVWKIFEVTCNG